MSYGDDFIRVNNVGWLPWFAIGVMVLIIARRLTLRYVPKYSVLISVAAMVIVTAGIYGLFGDVFAGIPLPFD